MQTTVKQAIKASGPFEKKVLTINPPAAHVKLFRRVFKKMGKIVRDEVKEYGEERNRIVEASGSPKKDDNGNIVQTMTPNGPATIFEYADEKKAQEVTLAIEALENAEITDLITIEKPVWPDDVGGLTMADELDLEPFITFEDK